VCCVCVSVRACVCVHNRWRPIPRAVAKHCCALLLCVFMCVFITYISVRLHHIHTTGGCLPPLRRALGGVERPFQGHGTQLCQRHGRYCRSLCCCHVWVTQHLLRRKPRRNRMVGTWCVCVCVCVRCVSLTLHLVAKMGFRIDEQA